MSLNSDSTHNNQNPLTIRLSMVPVIYHDATEPKYFAQDTTIQEILRPIKITNTAQIVANRVLLSNKDFKTLFPTHNNNQTIDWSVPYLNVANIVYKVAISRWIKPGNIGMNPVHFEKSQANTFSYNVDNAITVTPFTLINQPVQPLRAITLKISVFKDSGQPLKRGPFVLHLNQVRNIIREKLQAEVITLSNSFIFDYLGLPVLFQITPSQLAFPPLPESFRPLSEHYGSYGVITPQTLIDLEVVNESEVSIVEDIIENDKINAFQFFVKVKKYQNNDGKNSDNDDLPIILDHEQVKEKVKNLFQRERVLVGQKRKLADNFGIEFNFELKKVKMNESSLSSLDRVKYRRAYQITNEAKIDLTWSPSNLILTKGVPNVLDEIELRVVGHTETEKDKELLKFRKPWLSVQEIKDKLKLLNKTFVREEAFCLELSSGEYLLEVCKLSGDKNCPNDKREKVKNVWVLGDSTTIKLKAGSICTEKLVESSQAIPLKKVLLTVKPAKVNLFEKSTDSHIVSRKEVMAYLKEELLSSKLVNNQSFTIDVGYGSPLKVKIEELVFSEDVAKSDYGLCGKITPETEFVFTNDPESQIKVLAEKQVVNIKDPVKELEEMGLGGLSDQMEEIVRELFLFRGKMNSQAKRRGIKPEKGILFYGPPGTGKTAFARNLAQMLGAQGQSVRVISAPEIFNKWLGESEKKVRELFKEAKLAQKNLGKESPLMVIIVDEIDAAFSARSDDGNSARNSVVNQFLAELDGPGPERLDNILIIGMTNRKESIDPAVLRPGRLGIHIEIGLPTQEGREKIFEIHSRNLLKENLIEDKVDFKELAKQIDKWTGAEIEGVVKKAATYSIERLAKLNLSEDEMNGHSAGIVLLEDFQKAIEKIKSLKGQGIDTSHIHTGMYI